MKSDYDLLIIGAGPAGLSAAQYGARANLRVLVLEQAMPGGQALYIDVLENYPGITKGKTGFEFCDDLHKQAEEFGAEIRTGRVASVKKTEDLFNIVLEDGSALDAPALILATGARHKKLGIPRENEFYGKGVSYCAVCDGPFFKNKKIIVAGGGDTACAEANFLSRLSPDVMIVHRRQRFRAQKSLAQKVLDNPNIKVSFNTAVREIKGREDIPADDPANRVHSVVLEKTGQDGKGTGEIYTEEAGAVFIFAGTEPETALVRGEGTLNVETDKNGYVITDQKMQTSIPGFYAAGDLRSGTFRQVVVAAGEGATAAHNAAAYIENLIGEAYGS